MNEGYVLTVSVRVMIGRLKTMPAYKKKITRPMEFKEFEFAIQDLDIADKAFLSLLYFSGCRVSEALALTADDITCTDDTVFVNFIRLKGSKQTDPVPLPKQKGSALWSLCWSETDKLFPFSRTTAWRKVKEVFPSLYPHYFRANRITSISRKHGDAYVYSFTGICAQSIDHYRQKVNIEEVGKALQEEISFG